MFAENVICAEMSNLPGFFQEKKTKNMWQRIVFILCVYKTNSKREEIYKRTQQAQAKVDKN